MGVTKDGIPYPDPSTRVADTAAVTKSMAEAIDAKLDLAGRIAAVWQPADGTAKHEVLSWDGTAWVPAPIASHGAHVPLPGPHDAGKVLGADAHGQSAWVDAQSGPAISAGDAGKVLTVKADESGAEWKVVAVPAATAGGGDITFTKAAEGGPKEPSMVTLELYVKDWLSKSSLTTDEQAYVLAGFNALRSNFNSVFLLAAKPLTAASLSTTAKGFGTYAAPSMSAPAGFDTSKIDALPFRWSTFGGGNFSINSSPDKWEAWVDWLTPKPTTITSDTLNIGKYLFLDSATKTLSADAGVTFAKSAPAVSADSFLAYTVDNVGNKGGTADDKAFVTGAIEALRPQLDALFAAAGPPYSAKSIADGTAVHANSWESNPVAAPSSWNDSTMFSHLPFERFRSLPNMWKLTPDQAAWQRFLDWLQPVETKTVSINLGDGLALDASTRTISSTNTSAIEALTKKVAALEARVAALEPKP